MFDRDGLYLEVSPRGGKWWRLKYRYAGKEKRVSLDKGHGGRILTRFERDIFPWIGARPIADLTAPELLTTVRPHRKSRCVGDRASCAGQLRPGVPLCIATAAPNADPTGDLRRRPPRCNTYALLPP